MENKVKIYITRKKIKNMYLRVKEPDGRVEVSAPYNMKEEDIRRFIKAHEEWIQNAVLRIEEKNKNVKEAPVMAPFMEREMRQKLKKQIESLIKKWEPVMNVSSSGFTIKKMKTRWGTCNAKEKRVIFNTDLAKYNSKDIEYVILHELTHLIERTHNQIFVSNMDKYMPQWKLYKSELNSVTFE